MNSSNVLKKSDFELFLNKKPASPSCNIDFGPFGQSLDIIVALENAASIKTYPGSYHKDLNTKHLHSRK